LSIKKSYSEFQKWPWVLSFWNSVAASSPLPELVNEALYGTVASLRQKRRGQRFSNHRRRRRSSSNCSDFLKTALGSELQQRLPFILWNSGSIIAAAGACQ
jgi:hypothetical protein